MGDRRSGAWVPWIAVAGSSLAWLLAGFAQDDLANPGLVEGRWYAAESAITPLTLELPSRPDQEYRLVIGSLGDPERRYRIRLSASTARDLPVAAWHLLPRLEFEPWESQCADDCSEQAKHSTGPGGFASECAVSARGAELRYFDVHTGDGALEDPGSYERVPARLVAVGRFVRVYLDAECDPGGPAGELADEVVRVMEGDVIPRVGAALGVPSDVDGDGSLGIVLTNRLARLQGGRTSVTGFVRRGDFRTDLDRPFSNRADVIYLSTEVEAGPLLEDVLAHEFVHAVCARPETSWPQHDWISEGLAHQFETGTGNVDYRVDAYYRRPESSPLAIVDYYRSQRFRDHGCRGAAFLFMRWAGRKFGREWLRQTALTRLRGEHGLEATTGVPFDRLFREWTLDLGADVADSSLPRGRFGRFNVAGPRQWGWSPDEGPLTIEVNGSAAAFVVIGAAKIPGAGRLIRVDAPPGARLQVSVRAARSPEEMRAGSDAGD